LESNTPLRKYKCEGGESWIDVHNRASKFLNVVANRFVKVIPVEEEEEKEQKIASNSSLDSSKTAKGNGISSVTSDKSLEESKSAKPSSDKTSPGLKFKQSGSIGNSGEGGKAPIINGATTTSKPAPQSKGLFSCFGSKEGEKKQTNMINAKPSHLDGPLNQGSLGMKNNRMREPREVARPMSNLPSLGSAEGDQSLLGRFPKILVVTHGGYIMELLNVVCARNGNAKPINNNDSLNCSITIVVGYCDKTKGKCTEDCKSFECVKVKACVRNEISHLAITKN